MKQWIHLVTFSIIFSNLFILNAQEKEYLRRDLDKVPVVASDLSTGTASYRAIFGAGDPEADMLKGVTRYGHLRIEPGGNTKTVAYAREEQVWYILGGSGILHFGKEKIPVSTDDYFYLPPGVRFSLSNPREREMAAIIMGFDIPTDSLKLPEKVLHIASADDVQLQVVGKHPPSTKFKLLMGTIHSTRDRLAAAYQVNSLFIMDFAPGGTNNPHIHPVEEEIYIVLRGKGDMVAGGTLENGHRYPAEAGDAFFFPRNTVVGFYSDTIACVEHAMILAVRSKYPKKLNPENK